MQKRTPGGLAERQFYASSSSIYQHILTYTQTHSASWLKTC
jgi:hypothetical protein